MYNTRSTCPLGTVQAEQKLNNILVLLFNRLFVLVMAVMEQSLLLTCSDSEPAEEEGTQAAHPGGLR